MLFYANSITTSVKHNNRKERYEIMDDMDSTNTTGSETIMAVEIMTLL
jgi:hypothetical protein